MIVDILAQRPDLLLVFVVPDLDLDLLAALSQHANLDGFVARPVDVLLPGRHDYRGAAIALDDEIALAKTGAAAQDFPGDVVLGQALQSAGLRFYHSNRSEN